VTDPPNYMWYWERNLWEGTEPADAIDIHTWEEGLTVFALGASLERGVQPSRIERQITVQCTVAYLRIEEPLPDQDFRLGIY
jgi:hypothetical protein